MVAGSGARVVWVVDDGRLDAERARRALARHYTVATFHDGSAALEQLSAGIAPDVMVLDWVMPGVSGIDVCRFLRAAGPASQKIGVLLLTVHRDTEQIVEGLSAGANDYLAKPYEDEEMLARVRALVRTRELVERIDRAEAENRRLLETAPDPLLVTDAQGRLTFLNGQAALALAAERNALLGRSIDELIPDLSPSSLLDMASPILRDVTIGARRFSPTVRALPAETPSSVMISLRDVTERRLLEERRLDFYSIIAHDLRTPLNAMTLRIASMRDSIRDRPADTLSNHLEKLDLRLRSVVEMINDFLEFASLEGASYRLERKPVDLCELVRLCGEELEPLLERNEQTLEERLPEPTCAVIHGDVRRLKQVLDNLLGNAVKFTGRGGRIVVTLQADDGAVELSVEDNGIGIASTAQGALFQRYSRAHEKIAGTGLGLLIVREIIEAHGGEVGVESREGHGSRFWFRLPRTPAAI